MQKQAVFQLLPMLYKRVILSSFGYLGPLLPHFATYPIYECSCINLERSDNILYRFLPPTQTSLLCTSPLRQSKSVSKDLRIGLMNAELKLKCANRSLGFHWSFILDKSLKILHFVYLFKVLLARNMHIYSSTEWFMLKILISQTALRTRLGVRWLHQIREGWHTLEQNNKSIICNTGRPTELKCSYRIVLLF